MEHETLCGNSFQYIIFLMYQQTFQWQFKTLLLIPARKLLELQFLLIPINHYEFCFA